MRSASGGLTTNGDDLRGAGEAQAFAISAP